jgi:hypothetical protein
VNYGFGYGGVGYEGGYWRDGAFFYNRTVNNVGGVAITNVYNKTVIVNNTSNVSFNGGAGGLAAKPTPQQVAFAKERHIPPTQEQTRHVQTAAKDPALSLSKNQGHPAVAATPQPALLKGPGVIAAKPGNRSCSCGRGRLPTPRGRLVLLEPRRTQERRLSSGRRRMRCPVSRNSQVANLVPRVRRVANLVRRVRRQRGQAREALRRSPRPDQAGAAPARRAPRTNFHHLLEPQVLEPRVLEPQRRGPQLPEPQH